MNNKVKEFIESTPTWVEEEMERLEKLWNEETIKWLKENHDREMITWKQSSSTRENYKPMQSELTNKEEIIKKQIEVIKELNEANSSLYNDIKELGEDLQSQDTGIKALIQDWKELREECAKQTKEVQRLNDKIKILSELNDELHKEIIGLKIEYKDLYMTPVFIPYNLTPLYNSPYNPPYIVTCSNTTLK